MRYPKTLPVTRKDGKPLEPNVPEYLVEATSYPVDKSVSQQIKIIDFGGSFFHNHHPEALHTPVVVQPPEVIFGDILDYRVDLWSMGCMVSVNSKSPRCKASMCTELTRSINL